MKKQILLVEDEDSDVFFMRLAMEEAGVDCPLAVAVDGEEAIAYLRGEGKFADRAKFPKPQLVLLDLRLPKVPGLDVLKWMREQPSFKLLPVIICSASNQDADVEAAYGLGANSYIVKPTRPSELVEIVRALKKYWLDADGPPADCEEWLKVTAPAPDRSGSR